MRTRWILIPVTCLSLVLAGWADAEGASRSGGPGRGLRSAPVKHAAARNGAGLRLAPARSGIDLRGGGVRMNGASTRGRGGRSARRI